MRPKVHLSARMVPDDEVETDAVTSRTLGLDDEDRTFVG